MRILIACEESQRVTLSYRKAGFEAWSCDIVDTSGERPEWHIKGDALYEAYSGNYDLIIAFPPCTYITKASAVRMYPKGKLNETRLKKGLEAKKFFMALLNSPAQHICIENPTPLKIIGLPKESQVIQPYQFGHPYSKRTLLWLKNLPYLKPTKHIDTFSSWVKRIRSKKERSKTFWGIAKAMSEQWTPEKIKNRPIQYQLFR